MCDDKLVQVNTHGGARIFVSSGIQIFILPRSQTPKSLRGWSRILPSGSVEEVTIRGFSNQDGTGNPGPPIAVTRAIKGEEEQDHSDALEAFLARLGEMDTVVITSEDRVITMPAVIVILAEG